MARLYRCVNVLVMTAALTGPLDPGRAEAAEPAAAHAETPPGVIQLDETVISGNQELPKVLYIVPWQQPDGLPEIELEADFTEAELFRRLYPPAHRRELGYLEAWNATRETNESAAAANGPKE